MTSIGASAFAFCTGLTSITLPNSLTSIGAGAFYYCSGLTSIELPASLTSIGGAAFTGCSGLTSIELPASLTSIGHGAFQDCTGLTSVTVNSLTPPSLGIGVFVYCHSTLQIKVPQAAVDAYKSAPNWSKYSNRISAID